jgi:hypothetical protein
VDEVLDAPADHRFASLPMTLDFLWLGHEYYNAVVGAPASTADMDAFLVGERGSYRLN